MYPDINSLFGFAQRRSLQHLGVDRGSEATDLRFTKNMYEEPHLLVGIGMKGTGPKFLPEAGQQRGC